MRPPGSSITDSVSGEFAPWLPSSLLLLGFGAALACGCEDERLLLDGGAPTAEAGCVPATTSCELECGWIEDECGSAIRCGGDCPSGLDCVGNRCVCVVKVGDCGAIDSDCDGEPDESLIPVGRGCETGGLGVCATGTIQCIDGLLSCVRRVLPSGERCDGLDNDCDGAVDEEVPGAAQQCDTGLSGLCAAGTVQCVDAALTCVQGHWPSIESCDGQDNDCNGAADDGDAPLTFRVHGPPDNPSGLQQVFVTGTPLALGAGAPPGLSLDWVAPLTWAATVRVPICSVAQYQYTRDGTLSTVEVGPLGEAMPARSVRVDNRDRLVEDAIWQWGDRAVVGAPWPAEKGPVLSFVGDGATEVTLAVQFAQARDFFLRYGTESGNYDYEASFSGSNRYEAVLADLIPGTEYYYTLSYGSLVTSEGRWRTSQEAGEGFRFVAFGDTRSGHSAHRDVVALAYSFHPEVVVHTGDLVAAGSSDADWDAFFAIERPLLASAIFLPVLGNHEQRDQRYFDFFALPPAAGNEEYYQVRYQQVLFIILSTESIVDLTQDEVQTAWLEGALSAANADASISWKVVALHQPPFSSGMHGSNASAQSAWHQLFVDYGVDLVLAGHDHDFEHILVDGVHYVVTAGGGAPLYPVGFNSWTVYSESTYHVMVFEVEVDRLSATAYRTDGSVLHAFDL